MYIYYHSTKSSNGTKENLNILIYLLQNQLLTLKWYHRKWALLMSWENEVSTARSQFAKLLLPFTYKFIIMMPSFLFIQDTSKHETVIPSQWVVWRNSDTFPAVGSLLCGISAVDNNLTYLYLFRPIWKLCPSNWRMQYLMFTNHFFSF